MRFSSVARSPFVSALRNSAQALLINRSPRLEDLSTEAFARLRAHPAPAKVQKGEGK